MAVPLCVDLDGTLVREDCTARSFSAALDRAPWTALDALILWPFAKAQAKARLAALGPIDPSALTYRPPVLELIRSHREGPRLLVTASHQLLADAVAAHLKLFDEVLASDDTRILKAELKANLLLDRFGTGGFDYAGNSRHDLPVWRLCRCGYLAGERKELLHQARHDGINLTPLEA